MLGPLLEARARVEARTSLGMTALHIGALDAPQQVFKLLELRASLADTTADGQTVLHLAARRGDPRFVCALLDLRAEPEVFSDRFDLGMTWEVPLGL